MFLIRTKDGITNVCTTSADQALDVFQSLRRADREPLMMGFGGRLIDVATLAATRPSPALTRSARATV